MENRKILSFVGDNFADGKLSILVVSTAGFCESLSESLKLCEIEDSSMKVEVHQALSMTHLLESFLCKLHFDFIVFAVDTRMSNVLETLKTNIELIDQHFMAMSRVCIAASNEIPYHQMSIDIEDLFEIAQDLNCPVLHGSILNEARCLSLAQRIVNLAATVTGARTGVPVILSRTDSNPGRLTTSQAGTTFIL